MIMFNKVLIVNCGVIVVWVICIFKQMGIQVVVVYVEVDVDFLYVLYVDEVYSLGEGVVVDIYLNQDKLFFIM